MTGTVTESGVLAARRGGGLSNAAVVRLFARLRWKVLRGAL